MTIQDFYLETLREAGQAPKPIELEKIASEKGVGVEVVKLAKAYFEQLQLDGIPYEHEQLRAVDSMKMAEAYFAHVNETKEAAVGTADGLLRFLEHAAEGFCAQHQIPLDGREALKVAGLQAESAQEYEAHKTAAFQSGVVDGASMGAGSSPAASPSHQPGQMYLPDTVHQQMGHPNLERAIYLTKQEHPAAKLETGADLANFKNNIQYGHSNAPAQGVGSWLQRNQGTAALGALGLGATYLWHKKNKEEENMRRDREMSALRAAALPPA